MPRTVATKEEAKGAQTFVAMQRLMGRERIEKMNAAKKRLHEPVEPTGIMSDYIVNNWHRQKLIYCRFGEKYI